jgi:hypothetical protein
MSVTNYNLNIYSQKYKLNQYYIQTFSSYLTENSMCSYSRDTYMSVEGK